MITLTKENTKQHCRTCLIKTNVEECVFIGETNFFSEREQESKDIWIQISENGKLQALIDKYITEDSYVLSPDECPQQMCLSCFNKIHQADKFLSLAKLSAKRLYNFLNNKIEEEDVQAENDDIYKLLAKESLMETETVLLENTLVPEIAMANHSDPFSLNNEQNKSESDFWDSAESSEADNDFEASSMASSMEEKAKQTKPPRRSSKRIGKKLYEETDKPVTEKRKRRTKAELAALVTEKLEDQPGHESKAGRQKGMKNSFKCSQCQHGFAHKITLDAHVRKVHEGSSRPFHCDRCDKAYSFIGGLYTHIKEVHEKEQRSHTCDFPQCGRTYTSFIAMQKHKRFKHTSEGDNKKYVCEECGASFNQSCNLRYHKRSKHPTEAEIAKKADVKLFECEICKKMFHTCYTLKYHKMQLHSTEMKFECEICGVKKAKKFMLAQHMLVHSTDKMPCEHCGRQFIRKFELEAHVRTVHMKIKPFECKYCLECFASRKTLRHHEYTHTGEKPYVCDICGQAYRQPTCLKTHKKTHEKFLNVINRKLENALHLNETEQNTNEMAAGAKIGDVSS